MPPFRQLHATSSLLCEYFGIDVLPSQSPSLCTPTSSSSPSSASTTVPMLQSGSTRWCRKRFRRPWRKGQLRASGLLKRLQPLMRNDDQLTESIPICHFTMPSPTVHKSNGACSKYTSFSRAVPAELRHSRAFQRAPRFRSLCETPPSRLDTKMNTIDSAFKKKHITYCNISTTERRRRRQSPKN